eukprot:6427545-Heterocapsa_arctica.AAC.1
MFRPDYFRLVEPSLGASSMAVTTRVCSYTSASNREQLYDLCRSEATRMSLLARCDVRLS